MRKLVFIILICITRLVAYADEIQFTASAPDVVVNGEQFRLTFVINSTDVKDFRAPSITDFDVLMGPTRSQQTSVQVINGRNISNSSTVTYTYILSAIKEGEFTISGATIKVDNEQYTSNSVTIKVLPPDQNSGGNNQTGANVANSSSTSGNISNNDLFIVASVNKTKVYEQEAILLTYKVYTTLNLVGLQGKMPDLKGFHTQEVSLPRNKTFSLEHYKGRNYKTLVWSQYVLFPQQTGELEIPSITFEGVIAQEIQINNPFDFFNGGSNYTEVRRKITAPKVSVNVLPLPDNKPASYTGTVGDFSLSSSINTQELKTGEAVTLRLVVSGVGNMKLISTPDVKFPHDFEVYDPKVDDQFSLTNNGLSGNKIFEYLAIPRHPGTYKIPAVELTYFDLKTKSYKTLRTEEYELNVTKGEGDATQMITNFTSQEDVKILGKDILYIKLGETTLHKSGEFFCGSLEYYCWYIISFILFVIVIIIGRKHAVENANIVKMRTKKANKLVTKRMKKAFQLLSANRKEEFYDEVLKAMWGYVSDKLNIPVSRLTKDNVENELIHYGISSDVIQAFMNSLNECEFARYAPRNENEAMDKVYASAIDVIGKIEDNIKQLKSKKV